MQTVGSGQPRTGSPQDSIGNSDRTNPSGTQVLRGRCGRVSSRRRANGCRPVRILHTHDQSSCGHDAVPSGAKRALRMKGGGMARVEPLGDCGTAKAPPPRVSSYIWPGKSAQPLPTARSAFRPHFLLPPYPRWLLPAGCACLSSRSPPSPPMYRATAPVLARVPGLGQSSGCGAAGLAKTQAMLCVRRVTSRRASAARSLGRIFSVLTLGLATE